MNYNSCWHFIKTRGQKPTTLSIFLVERLDIVKHSVWIKSSYFLIFGNMLLLLSRFSRVWLCNPKDSSPPGFPISGILQARTLEWVAISFSNARKWKVKVKLLSRVWLLATPWTAAYQASPSMGFSRQEYWSGVPFPSPLEMLVIFAKEACYKSLW